MSGSMLSKVPVLGRFVDERFLEHRRRSTSAAGIAGGLGLVSLLEYHIFHDHVIRWDLLGVMLVMVTVKLGLMAWYKWRD
jgi:hypothetical protein